jgi:hypothetical protein
MTQSSRSAHVASAMEKSVSTETTVTELVAFFEHLSPSSLAGIQRYYAPTARFKDPFNEVEGVGAIAHIFLHMFDALESPRFVVVDRVVQGSQCFLTWEFHFRFKSLRKGQDLCILGASHLLLGPDGLITLHRDYWDAAEELYEKLPLLGGLMRWLKRQAAK